MKIYLTGSQPETGNPITRGKDSNSIFLGRDNEQVRLQIFYELLTKSEKVGRKKGEVSVTPKIG
jgi:hypothetical protein